LVHVVPLTQFPVASQVWGVSPLHPLLLGVQTPVHAPLTHAEAAHVAAAPHWPLVEQVSTPLFEH
jgi:hypothetical protein